MLTGMNISRQPRRVRRAAALALVATVAAPQATAFAQAPPAAPTAAAPRAVPAWVAKSNELAKVWLEAQAKMSPESAGQMGLEGYDEGITDRAPGYQDRARAVVDAALVTLRARHAA